MRLQIDTDGTVPNTKVTLDGKSPFITEFYLFGDLVTGVHCTLTEINPETREAETKVIF